MKKYPRKDFLRLAALANLAILAKPLDLLAAKMPVLASNENVTYYKKGSAEYEELRKGFNKRIHKSPLVIAVCHNTEGAAEAIRFAIDLKLPVAIKSGGHCMEGFSCNDNGMVINLSSLNKIEWAGNDMIKIQPGCTLSQLYDVLLPKGKIIPGGSCGSVGIGGLTLGGGYGLLARKFGLTCDSLTEITMVDGTGKIRNSSTDPELLWACKGGGNGNFGVITEMKFKLQKAPATLQSFRFKTYKATTAKARTILQKWFEVTAGLPNDCFSAFVLNRKTVYILLTNAGKHSPAVQLAVDALTAVSGKTTRTKPLRLAGALKVFYGEKGPLFFKNASAGLYKSFADIEAFIEKAIDAAIATPGMIYQVNTMGGTIQNAVFENTSAFPHRAFGYFSELQTYWENEKQTAKALERFQAVQDIFNNNGIVAQYRNYPDINFKQWEQLYYGINYSKLQQIKNKYDPNNIIRHEQSVRNGS